MVYQINCESCDHKYIGQTSRKSGVRVGKHKKDVKKNCSRNVLNQHSKFYKHEIDFEKVIILDMEKNYRKRLHSEMMFIEYNENTMNRIVLFFKKAI